MRPNARADADECWKRAKTASMNSNQQSAPMAASEPIMTKTIMVAASVRIGLTGAPTTTTKARCRV